jgi:hypothetical protein
MRSRQEDVRIIIFSAACSQQIWGGSPLPCNRISETVSPWETQRSTHRRLCAAHIRIVQSASCEVAADRSQPSRHGAVELALAAWRKTS